MNFKQSKVSKIIKIILSIKLGFLGIYFATTKGILFFAEKGVKASEGVSANDNSSKNNASPDSSEPKKVSANILDSLLQLDNIDTKTISKDQIGKYMTLIERAKREAEDRIETLKTKAAQLEKMDILIKDNIKKLEEEKQFFLNTVQKEKEIKETRLATLVNLYAKMEPKKAAPVFEKLDKDLMVALFKKMREKEVTKILEAMSPDNALKATEYFGRVGSAREWDILKQMNQSLLTAFEQCKTIDKGQD